MIQPPYWLTDESVDRMCASEYDQIRREFMEAFTAEEERLFPAGKDMVVLGGLAAVMEQARKRRTFWYSLALTSPTGLLALFYNHIQPLLTVKATAHGTFHEIMPWYWKLEIFQILRRKVLDKKDYDAQLRQAFEYVSDDDNKNNNTNNNESNNDNSKGKGKENPQIDTT